MYGLMYQPNRADCALQRQPSQSSPGDAEELFEQCQEIGDVTVTLAVFIIKAVDISPSSVLSTVAASAFKSLSKTVL